MKRVTALLLLVGLAAAGCAENRNSGYSEGPSSPPSTIGGQTGGGIGTSGGGSGTINSSGTGAGTGSVDQNTVDQNTPR